MEALRRMRIQNNASWLDLALASDKENVPQLQAISSQLRTRYPDYDDIIDQGNQQPVSSIFRNRHGFGPEKELLRNFYYKAPANLNVEFSKRRNSLLSECPYCGYPEKPNTLDHFMPEGIWPEFALYPDNLVPQCIYCARIKSSRYYSEKDQHCYFIHPFYSDLLGDMRFNIELSLTHVTATELKVECIPGFKVPPNTSPEDRLRLKLHIQALKIAERISQFCAREHDDLKNFITKGNLNHHPVNVERYCQAKCDTALTQAGMTGQVNAPDYPHWASAYYVALVNNAAVMNYYKGMVATPPVAAPATQPVANTTL